VATDWPGDDRRRPRRTSATYAVRAPLARWLRSEAERAARELGSYRVLDVGCGIKPYFPFFAPYASEYVGVDVDNPAADLEGSVEQLPVADGSFEVVLCTQVLEHTTDPARAVRELGRVVAPRGRVLASTHGVQVYHPAPDDYWRWTHTGLERLFRENGDWESVTVRAGAGSTATIAMIVGTYVDLVAQRIHARVAGKPLVYSLNVLGSALDRTSRGLREPTPGALIANYHVVAEARG
jgi:SAM-dependent methyltransferase